MGALVNRNVDELLWIGPQISVRIIKVRGNRVLLDITGPRELAIWRGENPPDGYLARGEAAPPALKPGAYPCGGKSSPHQPASSGTSIRGTP